MMRSRLTAGAVPVRPSRPTGQGGLHGAAVDVGLAQRDRFVPGGAAGVEGAGYELADVAAVGTAAAEAQIEAARVARESAGRGGEMDRDHDGLPPGEGSVDVPVGTRLTGIGGEPGAEPPRVGGEWVRPRRTGARSACRGGGVGPDMSPQPHGATATGGRDQRCELAGGGSRADYRWCVLTD